MSKNFPLEEVTKNYQLLLFLSTLNVNVHQYCLECNDQTVTMTDHIVKVVLNIDEHHIFVHVMSLQYSQ